MMRRIIIGILMILLLLSFSWAQESTLSISDMKVKPSSVSPGGTVLISCKVTHADGTLFIERVAATSNHGKWNTSYPMLYDDGTHGDKVENDGVYSLEINAPDTAGEAKIILSVVDKDKNEIESEPIILTVK